MSESRPKVIMFDVKGTLTQSVMGTHSPRSDSLIETLNNLKALGIQIFAVSSVADCLSYYGFPEDLLIPIAEIDKRRGVKKVIEDTAIPPNEMLFFGDDVLDRYGAESNSVPFIELSDSAMQLENILVEIFGKDILGKSSAIESEKEDTVPEEPKIEEKSKNVKKQGNISDLPTPEKLPRKKPGVIRRVLNKFRST